jgi:hypothetical protein
MFGGTLPVSRSHSLLHGTVYFHQSENENACGRCKDENQPWEVHLEFSTKKVEGLNFISHHLKRQ